MPGVDLDRFIDGSREWLDRAVAELRSGRKRSHWMWFIFPQIAGLGTSPMAARYAIRDRAEAEAFLTDPTLGAAYRNVVDVVWSQVVADRVPVHRLFGSPDDQKLVSSLTLFAGIAAELDDAGPWARFLGQADAILGEAEMQDLPRCRATQRFLEPDGH